MHTSNLYSKILHIIQMSCLYFLLFKCLLILIFNAPLVDIYVGSQTKMAVSGDPNSTRRQSISTYVNNCHWIILPLSIYQRWKEIRVWKISKISISWLIDFVDLLIYPPGNFILMPIGTITYPTICTGIWNAFIFVTDWQYV